MAGRVKTQGDQVAENLTWRQLIELEACARCGECQVWCPVYAQDMRESICARGKIAALRSLVNDSLSAKDRGDFLQSLYECSACGQCHVVCPVRIDTPELWEQARQALVTAGIPQPADQVKQLEAIKKSNNSYSKEQAERGRWADMAWTAGFLQAPIPLWRDRPTPFLYFAGCTASFDPQMQAVAVQSARLLQESGVEFSVLGPEEPCCASKLRRMGDLDFVAEARKRVSMINDLGVRTIIVSCAGCYKGFHSDYARLWQGGVQVLHLTQFIDFLIREGRLRLSRMVPMTVTYHDPCHLGRHNQVYDEPRRILRSVPGLKLVEMPRHRAFSSCCGMGGGLKLAREELQRKMSASRIREAESVGTEAVVTPCQTCCLGLLKGVNETGSGMKVHHLNEIVARSVCPEVTEEKVKEVFLRLNNR